MNRRNHLGKKGEKTNRRESYSAMTGKKKKEGHETATLERTRSDRTFRLYRKNVKKERQIGPSVQRRKR